MRAGGRRKGALAGTALVVLLAAAGCGADGATGGPVSVDPSWSTQAVGPVVLHLPADWQELDRSAAAGQTTATYGLPDDGEALVRPGVTVVVQDEPTQAADAAADALVQGERAQRGAEDVEVTPLDRADAEQAVGVSLWNEQRSADGPVEVRSRWLVADLEDGTQVVVGVLGPRDEFVDLPLDEVLDVVELDAQGGGA